MKHLFWSPVRDGENSAQTLFRVIGNLLRIGLALFLVWFVKALFFDAPYKRAMWETRVVISYDRSACSEAQAPLSAIITNSTADPSWVVFGIWLKVYVYEDGEQINRRNGTWRLFNAVIEPGESAQQCLDIPDFNPGRPRTDVSLLEYRAEVVELRRSRFEPGRNYDFPELEPPDPNLDAK